MVAAGAAPVSPGGKGSLSQAAGSPACHVPVPPERWLSRRVQCPPYPTIGGHWNTPACSTAFWVCLGAQVSAHWILHFLRQGLRFLVGLLRPPGLSTQFQPSLPPSHSPLSHLGWFSVVSDLSKPQLVCTNDIHCPSSNKPAVGILSGLGPGSGNRPPGRGAARAKARGPRCWDRAEWLSSVRPRVKAGECGLADRPGEGGSWESGI